MPGAFSLGKTQRLTPCPDDPVRRRHPQRTALERRRIPRREAVDRGSHPRAARGTPWQAALLPLRAGRLARRGTGTFLRRVGRSPPRRGHRAEARRRATPTGSPVPHRQGRFQSSKVRARRSNAGFGQDLSGTAPRPARGRDASARRGPGTAHPSGGKMRAPRRFRHFVAALRRDTQEKHKPRPNGLLLDRLKSGRFPELGQYRCPIFPAGLRAPGSQGRWLVACTTAKRDTKRAAIRAVRAHAA